MKMEILGYKFSLSCKCYSTRFKGCHFSYNLRFFPCQKATSWLPSGISECDGIEHQKRHNVTIVLNNNHKKVRALPLSLGLADAAATAADAIRKPVDISVLAQTSAVLLFMYFVANFVVPQIITGKFDTDEESKSQQAEEESP